MTLRTLGLSINRIIARSLHRTGCNLGPDSREKRAGHLPKRDDVEGERGTYGSPMDCYELPDENLLNKVINNMKFKDIPYVHIICTRNNTKMILKQGDGSVVGRKSAGTEGYKNCRKGTTVAAQAVANRVVTLAKDNEIDSLRLIFNGLGPGRNAAFKVFEMSGLNVVSLTDRTQAAEPWNLRPRKAKRL